MSRRALERIRKHDEFEGRVNEFLSSIGFYVHKATYHDDEVLQRLLSTRHIPTSMYIRHRADRVAVHGRCEECVFEWDTKTRTSSRYDNMTMEAAPFLFHVAKAVHFGIRCLIAWEDNIDPLAIGFWVDKMPPVECVMFPGRFSQHETLGPWYTRLFAEYLEGVQVNRIGDTGGSGTPYVMFHRREIENLPTWQDVIRDELRSLHAKELTKQS